MNAVRSCFAVVLLLAGRGGVAAAANSSMTGPSYDTCTNRTDGGQPCDGRRVHAAAAVRKCCPPDRTYDPTLRSCGGVPDVGVPDAFRLLVRDAAPSADVVHDYGRLKCVNGTVLVDVLQPSAVRDLLDAAVRQNRTLDPVGPPPRLGFCVDALPSRDRLVARHCEPRRVHCTGRGGYTCVNKCCQFDQIIVNGQCTEKNIPFLPQTGDGTNFFNAISNNAVLPYKEKIICSNGFQPFNIDQINLLENGSIYLHKHDVYMHTSSYCMDYYASHVDDIPKLEVQVCRFSEPSYTDTKASWKYIVLLFGFVLSIVCLVLTLLVYATLKSLRNVNGYYIMSYVSCLLMSYICILTIHWFSNEMSVTFLCKFIGYLMLFLFLATFCWLNVICFDIYWMLRWFKNMRVRSSSTSTRTIMYNIYCWGFSAIFVVTAFILRHTQCGLTEYTPEFGIKSCWVSNGSNDKGTIIFFIIPVSAMLIVNLVLFVLTALHCLKVKSEISNFTKTDSRTRTFQMDKEKFTVSIKLFLVMGIPWIFEMISRVCYKEWIVWHILDEINSLQGVMVFLIFVAKRKIIKKLREKITGSIDSNELSKMSTISRPSQSGSTIKHQIPQ